MADNSKSLQNGTNPDALSDGAALAQKALGASSTPALGGLQKKNSTSTAVDEIEASNQLAETLDHLQRVIENNVNQLRELKEKLKHEREMLKNVFENDTTLIEANTQLEEFNNAVKQRKSQLTNDPQVTAFKNNIAERNEEKKAIEEALNNHLLNYYSLTNSTSIDTSDGDQLDFKIRATVAKV